MKQKAKLEAKLHQTTSAATAGSGVVNSVPSHPSSAPGFFIHPSDVIPPTPKTTPLFMTPPLTPPNESVSAAISVELAQLFPGSVIDPPPVNLSAQNKNKAKQVSSEKLLMLIYSYCLNYYYLAVFNFLSSNILQNCVELVGCIQLICVCVVIAEPHRKWPGIGNLTSLSLSTASTTSVHNN